MPQIRPRCAPPAQCSTIWPKRKRRRSHTSISLLPVFDERTARDRPRDAPQPGARRHDARRRREGSLLGVLDRTVTSLGARLLADWLAAPLTDVAAINARLDAVDELVADANRCQSTPRNAPADLRHPAAACPRDHRPGSPRDLAFVGRTLACLPKSQSKAHRPREHAAAANSKRGSTCAPISAARSNRRSSTTARSPPATAISSAPATAPRSTSSAS